MVFKHLVVPKHLVVHHFPHQNGNFGYDQKNRTPHHVATSYIPLDHSFIPYLNIYIPVNLFLLYPITSPPSFCPNVTTPRCSPTYGTLTRRRAAQVGLLLMVRIVDFYRKRMQQRKAGELWGYGDDGI